jgi:DNA-binding MarR family transcriptional regulator
MVEALPDNHDRRRIVLQLTLAGRRIVEELQAQIEATNDKVLEPLSPNERDEFLRLLQRLT